MAQHEQSCLAKLPSYRDRGVIEMRQMMYQIQRLKWDYIPAGVFVF